MRCRWATNVAHPKFSTEPLTGITFPPFTYKNMNLIATKICLSPQRSFLACRDAFEPATQGRLCSTRGEVGGGEYTKSTSSTR